MLEKNPYHRNGLTLIARYSPKVLRNYKENVLQSILEKHINKIDSGWYKVIEAYKRIELKETSVYFFTSFISCDLFVGSTFNSIFNANEPDLIFKSESVILAILDEWTLIPIESVSKGNRCICMIDFPKGIPDIINKMKEVEKVTSMNQDIQICLYDL